MMSAPAEIPKLRWRQKLSYGVGHILNDLCASMWFSYLLIYFKSVLEFSNNMAGLVMLLGQIIDALSTPLVGLGSDRTGFCKYGKRKSWHLIGTISVVISFPFIFMKCFGCQNSGDWIKFVYYSPFVVIFQFGWAATQISHLALIPSLTPCESARVILNAVRYAGTVMSSCLVYCVTWLLLSNDGAQNSQLSPSDSTSFMILVLCMVGGGLVFSMTFHLGIVEEENGSLSSATNITNKKTDVMVWRDWLHEHRFYVVGALYMCTRLVVNLSQIYLPMFLTDTLNLKKENIARVPLLVFISGFLVTFLMKRVNQLIGRKATYSAGCALVVGACVWFYFLTTGSHLLVIGPAILIGAGTSTILVTSLSITADLIGDNCSSGAFVYGSISFTDKLSNGVAVALIQFFSPNKSEAIAWYYRCAMTIIPGVFATLAFLIVLSMNKMKVGCFKKLERYTTSRCEDERIENSPLLLFEADPNL